MKKTLLALAILIQPILGLTHEGHDNAPGAMKSLHGGVVQSGKQVNLEVIISGKEITIFPTSHVGLDIPTKDVKIEAIAKPKKGKPYSLLFSGLKEGFKAVVDLKGANRLPVSILVTNQGKIDHFNIQVEE